MVRRKPAKARIPHTSYLDQAGRVAALAALALLVVHAPTF